MENPTPIENAERSKAYAGMRIAMENKIVCDYCGTIYNADKQVCPLCGNAPSEDAKNRQRAIQRRRDAGEKRRERPEKKNPPQESGDPRRIPKKLAVAALVFLALSVLVWFYFIGDVNGWLPGLSSVLNADYGAKDASDETVNKTCTYLEILPESIDFTEKGQIQKLRVIINAGCEETVTFTSDNDKVINVSTDNPKSDTQESQTAITIDVTALGEGTASIKVSCGNKSRTCRITCDFSGGAASSEPSSENTFVPELNYEDITLNEPRETLALQVTNLPEGIRVSWTSSDETVATVDENGKVTAVGSGTAQITAEVDGGRASMTIRCNFDDTTESDDGTHLTHTDVSIAIGEEFNLRLIDGNGDRINNATYFIDDPDICSVSGVTVRGESRGTTEITVRYNGRSYTCIVRVG